MADDYRFGGAEALAITGRSVRRHPWML